MSTGLRPVSTEEVEVLWPFVRSAHLFGDVEAFRRWREEGPWRLLVSDAGDAAVVERWREHLDVLSVRALWCVPRRLPGALENLRSVARDQGLARVLSPLLDASAVRPYLRSGMEVCERLVAFRGRMSAVARVDSPVGVTLRGAILADVDAIASVEREAFDEFWRFGPHEIAGWLDSERVTVAYLGPTLVGYTLSTVVGGVGTLARLAVAASARRTGVGRALVGEAATGFERRGIAMMALCTQRENRGSRALYESCGLRESPGTLVFAIDR